MADQPSPAAADFVAAFCALVDAGLYDEAHSLWLAEREWQRFTPDTLAFRHGEPRFYSRGRRVAKDPRTGKWKPHRPGRT